VTLFSSPVFSSVSIHEKYDKLGNLSYQKDGHCGNRKVEPIVSHFMVLEAILTKDRVQRRLFLHDEDNAKDNFNVM
jgi:hypothetical protein